MLALVTGGGGFLGRHLITKLNQERYYVRNISRSECDLTLPIPDMFAKYDYIFHLAVDTKAGDYCLHHQADQWESNQLINANMLAYWRKYQPQAKMITFGTSCAYQDNDLDKVEENYLEGHPNERLRIYAMSKRMLYMGLKAYNEQYNMQYMYFVPNTLYGPNFELNDRHFIFELIQKISAAKYTGEPAVLWGSGHQSRELIYVKDAVDMIFNLKDESNEIVNLGTGQEQTIRTYAQIICDYLDYPHDKVQYDTDEYTGQESKKLQPSAKYGPCNYTNVTDGIHKTIDYYIENKYGEYV